MEGDTAQIVVTARAGTLPGVTSTRRHFSAYGHVDGVETRHQGGYLVTVSYRPPSLLGRIVLSESEHLVPLHAASSDNPTTIAGHSVEVHLVSTGVYGCRVEVSPDRVTVEISDSEVMQRIARGGEDGVIDKVSQVSNSSPNTTKRDVFLKQCRTRCSGERCVVVAFLTDRIAVRRVRYFQDVWNDASVNTWAVAVVRALLELLRPFHRRLSSSSSSSSSCSSPSSPSSPSFSPPWRKRISSHGHVISLSSSIGSSSSAAVRSGQGQGLLSRSLSGSTTSTSTHPTVPCQGQGDATSSSTVVSDQRSSQGHAYSLLPSSDEVSTQNADPDSTSNIVSSSSSSINNTRNSLEGAPSERSPAAEADILLLVPSLNEEWASSIGAALERKVTAAYSTLKVNFDNDLRAVVVRGTVDHAEGLMDTFFQHLCTNVFKPVNVEARVLSEPDAKLWIRQTLEKDDLFCYWHTFHNQTNSNHNTDDPSSSSVVSETSVFVTALREDHLKLKRVFESSFQTTTIMVDESQRSLLQSDAWKLCVDGLQRGVPQGQPAPVLKVCEQNVVIFDLPANIESTRRAVLEFLFSNFIVTNQELCGQYVQESVTGLTAWQLELLGRLRERNGLGKELQKAIVHVDAESDTLVLKAPICALSLCLAQFWKCVAGLSQKQISLGVALTKMLRQPAARERVLAKIDATGLVCLWTLEEGEEQDQVVISAQNSDQQRLKEIFTSAFTKLQINVAESQVPHLCTDDFQRLVAGIQENGCEGAVTPVVEVGERGNTVFLVDTPDNFPNTHDALLNFLSGNEQQELSTVNERLEARHVDRFDTDVLTSEGNTRDPCRGHADQRDRVDQLDQGSQTDAYTFPELTHDSSCPTDACRLHLVLEREDTRNLRLFTPNGLNTGPSSRHPIEETATLDDTSQTVPKTVFDSEDQDVFHLHGSKSCAVQTLDGKPDGQSTGQAGQSLEILDTRVATLESDLFELKSQVSDSCRQISGNSRSIDGNHRDINFNRQDIDDLRCDVDMCLTFPSDSSSSVSSLLSDLAPESQTTVKDVSESRRT